MAQKRKRGEDESRRMEVSRKEDDKREREEKRERELYRKLKEEGFQVDREMKIREEEDLNDEALSMCA